MDSFLLKDFWKSYNKMPDHVKQLAKKNFKLWQENNSHPSLDYKQIHTSKPFYSIRIGISWRTVGYIKDNNIYWFWIGSHSDYSQLISQL